MCGIVGYVGAQQAAPILLEGLQKLDKTTVYKVEDGKLVTSEIPGGFLDPSFSTV